MPNPYITKWMNEVYDTFKSHVTEARKNKLKKPLDEMAGGRVYTGQQALELGLVDKIGTLNDAVHFAAEKVGLKDYDVRIWEGDLRSFVGFGKMAPAQCASMQTFGAFNSLGPRVEWRMRDGKPFATILRWLTEANTDGKSVKQNWLVVTKLGDKDACHIAYIDTKYADANEVARQRADERAAAFNCAKDMPEIFSSLGGSATDYASGMPCPGGPYREE